jgi:hypothetical protein
VDALAIMFSRDHRRQFRRNIGPSPQTPPF